MPTSDSTDAPDTRPDSPLAPAELDGTEIDSTEIGGTAPATAFESPDEQRRPSATERSASAPPAEGSDRGGRVDLTLSDEITGGPDSGGPRQINRRALIALIGVLVFAVAVAVFWLLGERNRENFYIDCGEREIATTQGRSFPPWGQSRLSGAKWAPITNILELSQCEDEHFQDRAHLEERYREILLAQVDTWLEKLDVDESRERLPIVEEQLAQAELLSRSSDDGSKDARKRIGRLRGDLAYWQAYEELVAARSRLQSAAEMLRSAKDKRPLHVRDASEWYDFVLATERELRDGPPILRPAEERPAAPNAEPTGSSLTPGPADSGEPAAATPDGEPVDPETDASTEPDQPQRPAVPNPPPPASGTLL